LSVACGEGVVEKDRGDMKEALAAIKGTAGRRARDGARYLRIEVDMTGELEMWCCDVELLD
jgi:hypothetical protein